MARKHDYINIVYKEKNSCNISHLIHINKEMKRVLMIHGFASVDYVSYPPFEISTN